MDNRTEIRSRLTIAGILIFFLLQFGFWFIKETSKDLFFGKVSEKLVRFSESWGITEGAMVEWLSGSFSFLVSAGLAFFLVWMAFRLGKEATSKYSSEVKPECHYSQDDKDRISKLFNDLSNILADQATPMESEAQKILQAWNNASGKRGEITPLLLGRLKKINDDSSLIQHKLYAELPKEFHRDEKLIRQIIEPGIPNKITLFRQEVRNFILQLEHLQSVLNDAPSREGELVAMTNPMIGVFRHATAQLNSWIDQSQKRLREKDHEILGR